jgi:hypothetical protein
MTPLDVAKLAQEEHTFYVTKVKTDAIARQVRTQIGRAATAAGLDREDVVCYGRPLNSARHEFIEVVSWATAEQWTTFNAALDAEGLALIRD